MYRENREPDDYAYNQHKVLFHTTRCVFLGYDNSHIGYKCLNSHGSIFISRHVIFNEDNFPFHDGFLNIRGPLKTTINNPSICFHMCSACNSNNDESTPITKEIPPEMNSEERQNEQLQTKNFQDVNNDTEQTNNSSSDADITNEEAPDITQQNVSESSLNIDTRNTMHSQTKATLC